MFRRYFFPMLGSLALIGLVSVYASAQSGALRGHVMLKQADGTVVPAVGAKVDVFRTDLGGDYELTTGKKGEFVHVGLAFVGTYIIAASFPGTQPSYIPNVKVGREVDYAIELIMPGDGRRLTRAEIDTLMKAPGGGSSGAVKETAEARAKREEQLKKNAEVDASNKKAESSNAIINRTLKAGNEAFGAKNYELAITQYDEGLTADPDHPGAPVLLTNKSNAQISLGIQKYNAAVKSTDDAAKTSGIEAAKKLWTEASQAAAKAVELLKAAPAASDPEQAKNTKQNLYNAIATRAVATSFVVTKVDQTQADAGVAAYQEYMAVEIDPVKKAKAQHDLAQMLFDANVFDKSLVEYQKILEANPDDLDALLRSGQALFNIGAINTDKAKYQEAANFLARFVDKAPDTNPFKADAKAILETLKDQANVKPEKVAAPPRRTRRP